jgi:uncharacterized membrane protein (UPF0127 family)
MDADEGLLLRTASVHTSFMRFPIDVVFLDRELKVLRVVPALKPWRAALCRGATWTLELPAHTCEARGLRVGQTLAAEPSDALV